MYCVTWEEWAVCYDSGSQYWELKQTICTEESSARSTVAWLSAPGFQKVRNIKLWVEVR